ncbi:phosphoenolpyruvate--protein phosphotransferase [Desulfitobacterium sp. AusDCA]|uniref:phosphoenolpyruvate--protein phosphotransferase n=1 Tax=Desulfitobacterium sp. AusDCA TaxID=3240383 RepID=UPI003DA6FA38
MKGIAASPGIGIGRVYILGEEPLVIDKTPIEPKNLEAELKLLEDSIKKSEDQLYKLMVNVKQKLGKDQAAIFEAHLMMLQDNAFLDEIRAKISHELASATFAVDQVVHKYSAQFLKIEDEYLRERATDLEDIGKRLTKNLLRLETRSLNELDGEFVVIAKDLSPSDTAQVNKDMVKAIAIDLGGRTSHTAIMSRSLEIPAVVGLEKISGVAQTGDIAIVDGNTGVVILNPDEITLKRYQESQEAYLENISELRQLKGEPCITRCGSRKVELTANIGSPADCAGALENGAEGIGLYRTEFLYMQRDNLPIEEEQFLAYKEVAKTMNPHPVIIRTLDIGGDKKLPYLNMPEEMNPFLGYRAIRLCLDRPEIFKTQLRAILRASAFGKIRIMYPMISGTEELRQANAILNEAKLELDEEQVSFDRNVEVGIMIEIPSAAMISDILIQEIDFFSIGTNDLVQYTLAADRMNERISYLYNPLHPAVLRLIKNVIDASHRAGKWTGMCGEMAGDSQLAPVLLGLGLDEFSMSAVSIPWVKKVIRSLSYEQAKALADKALTIENPEEIKALLKTVLEN